ncbi:MAG: alpha/beta hydrolase [Pseudomonadota bacterium]
MALDHYEFFEKSPVAGAPLIFAFHGTGGNEHQLTELVGDLLPGAGIIAPRGDVSEHGALRFFRRRAEGDYDMEDLALRTQKMVDFVAAHKERYPGRPVCGLGYSNGANILASVTMERPDLIDRAALLHPLIPWQPEPVEGLNDRSVLITAGRRDPICPWPMTERLVAWYKEQGAAVMTAVHDGGHELRDGEINALAQFFETHLETT